MSTLGRSWFAVVSLLPLAPLQAMQAPPIAWEHRFDGLANHSDWGQSLAIAQGGEVYVTGTSFEPAQSVLVPKLLTVKLRPDGSTEWSRTFGLGYYGGNGVGSCSALDPLGRIVSGGQKDLGQDWVVATYDSSGNLVANGFWAAGSYYVSEPSDIAIDGSANVYLCGDIGSPANFQSAGAVVKFDSNAQVVWSKVFNPATELGSVRAMALAPNGEIYVVGSTSTANLHEEISVAKLSPAGAVAWIRHHGSPQANALDYGIDIRIDAGGQVIATGVVIDAISNRADASVIAYDSAGAVVWRTDVDTAGSPSDFVEAMELDGLGRIFLAGSTMTGPGTTQPFVACLGSGGALIWANSFQASPGASDTIPAMAMDSLGGMYLAGWSTPTATGIPQYLLVAVDAAGGMRWSTTYGSPSTSGSSYALAIATTAPGRVVITGQSDNLAQNYDEVTLAYDAGGPGTYCTGKVNSLGCTPSISAIGMSSASASSGFVIQCTEVRNFKNGLMFYGTSGTASIPFQGGTLCVKTPIRRTGGVNSGGTSLPTNDCSGVFAVDMNCFASGACGGHPLAALRLPGTIVDCQWWGRDPGFPAPNNTTLSNALEYVVQP